MKYTHSTKGVIILEDRDFRAPHSPFAQVGCGGRVDILLLPIAYKSETREEFAEKILACDNKDAKGFWYALSFVLSMTGWENIEFVYY